MGHSVGSLGMNRNCISETSRKSMEERKRRQQAQAEKKAPAPTPPPKAAGSPVTPASAKAFPPPSGGPGGASDGKPPSKPSELPVGAAELDQAVRESVLSSFSQWEVKLIPHLEGLARQVFECGSPSAGDPRSIPGHGTSGLHGSSAPGSGVPGGVPAEPGGPGAAAPDGDSWETLAQAVRELRREWDQETFENFFAEPGPAPLAEAETEDLLAPPPPAASRQPPAVSFQPPAASRQPPAVSPELSSRLEELIRLVKSSIAARGSGQVPVVPPELTREIAREVAGRLKANLGVAAPNPPTPGAAEQPATTERIPLDDVASIIDQITGSSPP